MMEPVYSIFDAEVINDQYMYMKVKIYSNILVRSTTEVTKN